MERDEFEEIVYSKKVEFKRKPIEYKKGKEDREILIVFKYTPYDILIKKLQGKLKEKKVDGCEESIYLRYGEAEDTWKVGYANFNLEFWKYIEDIFYNYKPEIYIIGEGQLSKVEKGDLLVGEKFFRSELDDYIE